MQTTKLLFTILAIATTLLAPASGALMTGCGTESTDCGSEWQNCVTNGNCETSFCKRCRGEGGNQSIKGRCAKCCEICTDPNPPSPTKAPTRNPTNASPSGGGGGGGGGCDGQYTGDQVSEINFKDVTILSNTLHVKNGQLRYEGVGTVNNGSVDLRIKDVSQGNRYPDIVDVWLGYNPPKPVPNKNGLNGFFGQINFQTVAGNALSGKLELEFCFMKTGKDNKKVEVKRFDFSFFDIDRRQGLTEELLIDLGQALNYKVSSPTELNIKCENGQSPPCPTGVKTVFKATQNGTGGDNPSDPLTLTNLQKSRSVTFTFENTKCFTVFFDQVSNGVNSGGGNILFAGESTLSTEPGTCITEPPTRSPTRNPTRTPTKNPTRTPTRNPTKNPTRNPTQNPTRTPIELRAPPSESPSGTPTIADSESPTIADSESPTTAPTDSPTHSPTANPSAAPSASPSISVRPSVAPSDAPSLSPSDSPTATPTAAPTYFDCPADILLSRTDGTYPIDLQESIKILEQTKSTVTVRLYNTFTTSGYVTDSIFFKYKEDEWSDKCFESQNVEGGTSYEDITIQCMHTVPAARLLICVADQGPLPLTNDDSATVPMCCNSDLEDDDKAVCYHVVVYCESHCTAEPTQSPTEAPIGATPVYRRNLYSGNDLFAINEIEIDDDDAPLWS